MSVRPDVGLERLIHGLEQELLEATDEEFVAGAHELGMNPEMKGSAAFFGVKDLSPQVLAALRRAYADHLAATARKTEQGDDANPAEPDHCGTSKRNADA
ncbi:MAG TPA: hypothetical protein VGG49_09315 [Steroidobacteraceae bacterium]|jgi:hypothetical protein